MPPQALPVQGKKQRTVQTAAIITHPDIPFRRLKNPTVQVLLLPAVHPAEAVLPAAGVLPAAVPADRGDELHLISTFRCDVLSMLPNF